MGSRSRRRERAPEPSRSEPARGPSRSARRDSEARAALKPLAPGERPLAVTIGAVVAAILGVTNLVLFLSGYEVSGNEPSPVGVVALSGLMLIAAVFMWKGRYWAVLGFQFVLGLGIVFSGLSLLVASNVEAVIRSSLILVASATLFWFLIKALARIQMPERPDSVRRHG